VIVRFLANTPRSRSGAAPCPWASFAPGVDTLRKIVLAALLLSTLPAAGVELHGIVTEVQDGDSVTLLAAGTSYKIRLVDIDAPELAQPRGKDSWASLSGMCKSKPAAAHTIGEDRFGRTLARIKCAGVDANTEQVRRGWAWVFTRYAPQDSPLYAIQEDARRARRGLWADDEPVAPWDWRKMKRAGEAD